MKMQIDAFEDVQIYDRVDTALGYLDSHETKVKKLVARLQKWSRGPVGNINRGLTSFWLSRYFSEKCTQSRSAITLRIAWEAFQVCKQDGLMKLEEGKWYFIR